MVGTAVFLGMSVLLCLTDTAVSVHSKCRVASFRIIDSFSTNCDIQFGYTTAPPEWIDQLHVVESFRNATDGQLDAFAKEACRCRMLRVHRYCPSDLFELIRDVAWRCFPGAREAVRKGIAGTSADTTEGTIATQGHPSGKGEHGEGRVLQLGRESGDGDQNSQDGLKTTDEEEAKEEGSGAEEMSATAPDVENTASDGTTIIADGDEESGDVTSESSLDVSTEESDENGLGIFPKDSSEDATEVPTAPEEVDTGTAEKSFETIPEGSSAASLEDSTEGPAGGSTREDGDDKDTTDTGSGDEFDEKYENEYSTEGLGGVEEIAVSTPMP